MRSNLSLSLRPCPRLLILSRSLSDPDTVERYRNDPLNYVGKTRARTAWEVFQVSLNGTGSGSRASLQLAAPLQPKEKHRPDPPPFP